MYNLFPCVQAIKLRKIICSQKEAGNLEADIDARSFHSEKDHLIFSASEKKMTR